MPCPPKRFLQLTVNLVNLMPKRKSRLQERSSKSVHRLAWNVEQVELLGTASDVIVANQLGVSENTVRLRRKKLKIPPANLSSKKKAFRWTDKRIAMLGKHSDSSLARRWSIDPTTVAWKRRIMSIPTASAVWSSKPVRQWSKREISKLGKMPDCEVARAMGLHRKHIAIKRRELKIPNFVRAMLEKRWTGSIIARLGKEPDIDLAIELDVSVTTVRQYRLRNKIYRRKPKSK